MITNNSIIPTGQTIKDEMDFLGMDYKQLSELTGLTEKHLLKVVSGHFKISQRTSKLISKALKIPLQVLENLEEEYQFQVESVNKRLPVIKRLKLGEDMANFLEKWDDPTALGFLAEWSLEKIFNGSSSKEMDNMGVDFISEKGVTYQVKCSTIGAESSYKALVKKVRNCDKIILVYADTEKKKMFYTVQ